MSGGLPRLPVRRFVQATASCGRVRAGRRPARREGHELAQVIRRARAPRPAERQSRSRSSPSGRGVRMILSTAIGRNRPKAVVGVYAQLWLEVRQLATHLLINLNGAEASVGSHEKLGCQSPSKPGNPDPKLTWMGAILQLERLDRTRLKPSVEVRGLRENDRHRLGMDRRNDRVGVGLLAAKPWPVRSGR